MTLYAFSFFGCSSTAMFERRIDTSNAFENKIKLKVGLYIPPEIKERITSVGTSTMVCSIWKAKIPSGIGYRMAIQNGLSSCIEDVRLSDSPINPEVAQREGYDFYVLPEIENEYASVTVDQEALELVGKIETKCCIIQHMLNKYTILIKLLAG